MPLRDHFHPPLSFRRHWASFPSSWATYLAADLNRRLPPGYFAEPTCTIGLEIDVAVEEEPEVAAPAEPAWSPPAPALTLPIAAATDTVEVLVYRNEGGPNLVGAVELVSPSNKDRPRERDSFVSKCAAYLHQGVGLVLVDVVTTRRANLHLALLARLANTSPAWTAELYAAAYHPIPGEDASRLEVWQEALAVGESLPTLPLWLRGGPRVPLALEPVYELTCQELRLSNGVAAQAPR